MQTRKLKIIPLNIKFLWCSSLNINFWICRTFFPLQYLKKMALIKNMECLDHQFLCLRGRWHFEVNIIGITSIFYFLVLTKSKDVVIQNVKIWYYAIEPHFCAQIQLYCRSSSLSLIHIWRCRRIERCRSRWSPYH